MKIYISKGELLFLDRRRAGKSQPQRAVQLEMDYYEYRRLEQEGSRENTPKDIPYHATLGDYSTIIRRRLCLSQEQVSEKLGSTRYLVNRMEMDEIPNSELAGLMRSLVQKS